MVLYKKFKEIGALLAERDAKGLRTYLRLAPPPKIESKLEEDQFTLQDLIAAAQTALRVLEERQSVNTVIAKPRVTIKEKISQIKLRLNTEGSASFSSLLGEDYTRVEVVVTFLALLELVRRYRIRAVQDNNFSEIRIEPTEEWDDAEILDIDFEG